MKKISLIPFLLFSVISFSQRVVSSNTLVTKSEIQGTTISPSQLTSDQDNWNPTGLDNAETIRLSGDATVRAITSITAPTQTWKPQKKTLINIGAYPVYFPGEHPDGTAANRFITKRDFILYPYSSIIITYDNTSSRWRITGNENDDFPPLNYQYSAASITAGDLYGLVLASGGTGATWSAVASTTTLPALARGDVGTTNAGSSILYFSKTSTTFTAFGSSHQFISTLISIPTLSDGTNTYTLELQITNTPSAGTLEANNTVGIRYSDGINSGKWELFSQDNAGAESVADLGITVAAATMYNLRLEIDKARTEARAYIDNVYVGRVTGNMPNAVVTGTRVIMLKSAGTTSRTMSIHNAASGAIF